MKASITSAPPALTTGLLPVLRRHPLSAFFLLAVGLSWIYDLILFGFGHLPLLPWAIPSPIIGPTFAAFFMTFVTEGRPGIAALLRRLVLWRVGVQWYVVALLGIPLMVLLSFLVLPEGRAAISVPALTAVLNYAATYIVYLVVAGPLFEEPGWRGFALPRLQERPGPLLGSVILGVIWSLWHLPFFLFIPGYDGAGSGFAGISISFAAFTVTWIAWALIYTWVFNNTRGSLLLAILLHTSLNTAAGFIHTTSPVIESRYICVVVMALIILAATRGHLGYERYKREVETAAPAAATGRGPRPVAAHV